MFQIFCLSDYRVKVLYIFGKRFSEVTLDGVKCDVGEADTIKIRLALEKIKIKQIDDGEKKSNNHTDTISNENDLNNFSDAECFKREKIDYNDRKVIEDEETFHDSSEYLPSNV